MSTARESDGSGTVATERQFEVNSRGGGEPSSAGSNETGEIKTFIEIMHRNSNLELKGVFNEKSSDTQNVVAVCRWGLWFSKTLNLVTKATLFIELIFQSKSSFNS